MPRGSQEPRRVKGGLSLCKLPERTTEEAEAEPPAPAASWGSDTGCRAERGLQEPEGGWGKGGSIWQAGGGEGVGSESPDPPSGPSRVPRLPRRFTTLMPTAPQKQPPPGAVGELQEVDSEQKRH